MKGSCSRSWVGHSGLWVMCLTADAVPRLARAHWPTSEGAPLSLISRGKKESLLPFVGGWVLIRLCWWACLGWSLGPGAHVRFVVCRSTRFSGSCPGHQSFGRSDGRSRASFGLAMLRFLFSLWSGLVCRSLRGLHQSFFTNMLLCFVYCR